jgi:hypothetical protein
MGSFDAQIMALGGHCLRGSTYVGAGDHYTLSYTSTVDHGDQILVAVVRRQSVNLRYPNTLIKITYLSLFKSNYTYKLFSPVKGVRFDDSFSF